MSPRVLPRESTGAARSSIRNAAHGAIALAVALALWIPCAALAADPATTQAETPPPAPAPTVPPAAPAPALVPIEIKRPARTDPVEFAREILPFLQPNCLPCHNKTASKGDLNLETAADMLKGGENGPAIVPGKAAESLLLKIASHAQKPRMPPKENKANAVDLTPAQLGLLALWIEQGAHGGEGTARPIEWQAMATNFHPALAVTISPDGRTVASGRANQVHLYHLAEPSRIQRLEDPELGNGIAQRDVVSSLAFSPDGEWLAAGGFREVRLWHRTPPRFESRRPLPRPVITAAASPSEAVVAVSLDDGTIALLSEPGTNALRTLPGLQPPASRLSFSPDGRRLAGMNPHGTLRIWEPASGSIVVTQAGSPVTAFAWADGGRQLAVAREGESHFHLYAVPVAEAGELALLREFTGHTQPITALQDGAPLGSLLVSGSEDGWVRVWSSLPETKPRELKVGSPVHSILLLHEAHLLAIGTRTNGTQLWTLGDTPAMAATLAGDARLGQAVTNSERRLKFTRNEVDYHTSAAKKAEEDVRKRTDESAKALEKHQANEKALAEKKQSLSTEEEKLAAANRDRTELTNSLQQATNRLEIASKAAEAARVAAHEAATKSTSNGLAAEQAARASADLERVLADLTGKADETVLARAREAATIAAKEATSKATAATESKTASARGIDELARLAAASGEAKAAADRANSELPPRIKQAEERVTAATKAVGDLKPQLEKARIQRETSEADVELTRRSLVDAKKSLDDSKAAVVAAGLEVTNSIARLEAARNTRDLAAGRGLRWMGLSGIRLLTLDDAGLLATWSLPSGECLEVISLPSQLQTVAGTFANGSPILRASDGAGLSRLLSGRGWELARRIGTGDSMSPLADRVNAVAFSPDGLHLATGGGEPSRSGELKIWSVNEGNLVRDLGAIHSDCVLSVAYSPAGDLLASGGADRFLRVSDPATGKLVRNFEGHTHHVLGVAWRGDGRVLASAGGDGVVKIWNRLTGERMQNVEGFAKEVSAVQALGLAAEFVAVSGSGQARVFKESKEQIRTLPAGSAFLHALAVSPDGRTALAGGDDSVVRVWNVADGKVLFELQPAAPSGTQ